MIEDDLLLDLTRRYCEPHRHYHTLEHIASMLVRGRDLALTEEQILAVWFHDAIFEVESRTNEVDSAELAVSMLSARGYPPAGIEVVRQIVLDSELHVPSIDASAPVIDLDLCSLAADPALYERNGENLRRENAHLTDVEYTRGLRGFLETFLSKERIFWTEWGQPLEVKARANMQRTLDELTTS